MSSNSKQIAIAESGMTPEAIAAQEITDMTVNTVQWAEYGTEALKAQNAEETGRALEAIRSNLTALLKANCLTPAILAAQAKALQEATTQYIRLAERYEVIQTTFNQQVGEALDEAVEHLLGCDSCRDEAEIEMLANRMLDEGQTEIEAEARETLERQLREARELAHYWEHEKGLEKGPGISDNFTFQANGAYPDPNGILDEDDDLDEDPDLLTDGDDDADDEEN